MATRPQFHPDQKVFAKVRGYPPWPAKVCSVADETPGKQRYNVYFYGTHETAVCKIEELFDYVDSRRKYGVGKPLKRKFFPEALRELEAELGTVPNDLVEPPTVPPPALTSADKDSDDELSLVIDESPPQKPKPKTEKILKRKLSSGSTDVSETPTPELTSRSGRKIKPKKFLDEPSEFNSPAPTRTPKPKISKEPTEENGKLKKSSDGAPEVTNGDKVELHWDGSQNVQDLIDKSERSELPKTVKKDFKKSLKKKADESKSQKQSITDNEHLEYLKVEVHLLDADCRIKTSLGLAGANCEECLSAMDEILDLKLNALILKKHPEVVDTVKKLRKYVGNVTQWKLTPEQERQFQEGAHRIRAKAETMYNKFQSLFLIPQGKSFWDVYSNEVNSFQQKTNNMSVNEIYGLVKEPLDYEWNPYTFPCLIS